MSLLVKLPSGTRLTHPLCGLRHLRASALPRFRASALPRFRASALPRFRASALPRFRASALPRFRASALPRFRASALPRFRASALPRFRASALPRFRASALRQGCYQAIMLDSDSVGAVCHYIHLNPVRASLVAGVDLQNYVDSSFHQIWYPSKRWSFFEASTALSEAGGLSDTRSGRRSYRGYLEWLSTDDTMCKQLGFEKMCKGWAKGSKDFK
ncbi:hypothetical protein ACWPKO_10220 [Coraliomargarita sp. W4R53]